MASTNPRFAMLDPTTLPSARSGKPSKAALTLTMSSGAEVAKETTVIPIIILDMFNLRDKATADFRSQLPPRISNAKPAIMKRKFCIDKVGKVPNKYRRRFLDQMRKSYL